MMRLIRLETCESTNDEAWKGLPETTLVVTKRQTRGRGRQGRRWEDDDGNLMASLAVVPPQGLIANALWIPLAAGVAAAEAVKFVIGRNLSGLRLKWPNDIYWEHAKMGGILCESRVSGEQLSGLVIGFGLNIVRTPQVADLPVASLREKIPSLPDDALERILTAWSDRVLFSLEMLAHGQCSNLRQAWLEHARLKEFPALTSHDRDGNVVKLTALDLESDGKLKASIGSKIVYLDQPVV